MLAIACVSQLSDRLEVFWTNFFIPRDGVTFSTQGEPLQASRSVRQEGRVQDQSSCVGGYIGFLNLQGLQQLHASVRPEVNAEQRSWGTMHALPWDWVMGCTGRERVLVPGLQLGHNPASSSEEKLHLLERNSFDSLLGKGWKMMKSVF